jgi:hypothetical protein
MLAKAYLQKKKSVFPMFNDQSVFPSTIAQSCVTIVFNETSRRPDIHVTFQDEDRKSLLKEISNLEKKNLLSRRGEKMIELDELMQVLVSDTWLRLRNSQLLILQSLFMACDVHGDGVFSSDDFHDMVTMLRTSVTK